MSSKNKPIPAPPVNVRIHTADGESYSTLLTFDGHKDGIALWTAVAEHPEQILLKEAPVTRWTADKLPSKTQVRIQVIIDTSSEETPT